jgi:hypothetical protein
MTDRELMQQALDALESVFEGDDKGAEYWTVTGGTYEAVECMQSMRALRARLAQPEREWQGLTDEDVWELAQKTPDFSETVAAVEAKLKEKNYD